MSVCQIISISIFIKKRDLEFAIDSNKEIHCDFRKFTYGNFLKYMHVFKNVMLSIWGKFLDGHAIFYS